MACESVRGRRAKITVADTGVGIKPEHLQRIFDLYFTTKERGSGIGLSMVYRTVQMHDGEIEVQSTPGKGTTFTIALPATSAPRKTPSVIADRDSMPRGTETILLIEDEPELRELARRTLESLGYTVIAPEHTEDSLAVAISRKVDLLLSDIVMPVMSGPTIVRRLRDVGATPPVVYMTGYADETLSEYRLEAGSKLLRKPFSPSQLARVIRSALDAVVGQATHA
jgi:CheY-like chemotaxis protein